MFRKFWPYAYANNVFEIDPLFFTKQNVSTVLIDLDNTLDSYRLFEPSSRVFELKERLQEQNIKLVIISNNKGPRVREYAGKLGVTFLSSAHKPFKKRILAFLAKENIKTEEVMLIGDQLLTDVWCGFRTKIRVILTEPVVSEDQWTTRFNRRIDRPIRNYLRKKGKLMGWVIMHGKL